MFVVKPLGEETTILLLKHMFQHEYIKIVFTSHIKISAQGLLIYKYSTGTFYTYDNVYKHKYFFPTVPHK